MYFKKLTQIKTQSKAQVEALLFDKAFTEVLAEYFNYSNVFLVKNTAELSENTGINEHAIKLKKDKQPLFGLIYNLGLIKLETLKTYIKTNLVNGFIRSFKSLVGALILFDIKLDRSFCLYIDY